MDEQQKIERRLRKKEVAEWLATYALESLKKHHIKDVEVRLYDYVSGCVKNPDKHNIFELLAIKRFLVMLGKYEFRENAVKRKIIVLESLPFPSKSGMKPVTLTGVQTFLIAGIYGFYKEDGRRLVTRAMLFVPRKFGKTTIVAGLAEDELVFGEADAQVYACANSYQQAKICFDNIRKSLKALDRTGNKFRVNREAIYNNMKGKSSFAKCLAADPTTLDGLNASLYILDEFSQSKSAELRNVMATSTGTRDNPLELIITTASDLLDSPFVDTLNANKGILLENMEDDSVFALIFEPDVDDREDDPNTWHKVQPHLGVTVKDDYYEQKYKEALQSAANMLAFRTKLLNVFATNETRTWMTQEEIRNLYSPFSFDTLEGAPFCMVSFDLSVWDDMSAVCYEIYRPKSNSFHFHVEYYLPERTLEKHPNKEMYKRWVDKGFLRILPGETIDYEQIARDIVSKNGKVKIIGIGYDPYKSPQAVNLLTAFGAQPVLKPYKQTYGEFTAPVESIELMIKNRQCTFSPNDIIAWNFASAVMDEDRNGNRKPMKRSANEKIDGAICCLMSQGMFNTAKR